jgi:hypothetical protein
MSLMADKESRPSKKFGSSGRDDQRNFRTEPSTPFRSITIATVTLASVIAGASCLACPFCGVVGPSLSERRDAAEVVAVGAADGVAERDPDGPLRQRFELHQALRGRLGAAEPVMARVTAPVEGTAILFGSALAGKARWEAIAADEPLIAHVAAAPAVDEPAARRLAWFAQRLEDRDPTIAEDAFAEFGRAPFANVREAAAAFEPERLRGWVAEPAGDQRRRGFYGLALGLVATHTADEGKRARCLAALRTAAAAPANDLRAGFDGILGGLLVAEGVEALAFFDRRGLLAADTRAGDARHVLTALRFAWENLGDEIPRERIAAATAGLVGNPAVAADAVVDLARFCSWEPVDRVAGLWDALGRDDPLVRRAVAGYLSACPLDAARRHRERIAAAEPDRWRQAVAAAATPAR